MTGSRGDRRPLVTIITPAYNRAELVRATIESVLAQDYPRVEHLVLDDGSTDHTREVLAAYGPRIRTAAHANMGESRTVNRGLELASGDIVGVLSSDDLLEPTAVSEAVALLERRPELVGTYADWWTIDADGQTTGVVAAPDWDLGRMVAGWMCFPGVGAFARREVLTRAGGRDPSFRFMADFELWLRVGLVGPLGRIARPLARLRVHAGSMTVAETGLARASEFARLADHFFSRADLPPEIRSLEAQARSSAFLQAATACGFSRGAWLARTRFNWLALSTYPRDDVWPLVWRAALLLRSAAGPWAGPIDDRLRRARDTLCARSPRLQRLSMRLRARGR